MVVLVRLGFRNASDLDILGIGEAVLHGMSGNPDFPDPIVSMATLEAALDEFSRAIQARQQGGKLATAIKNNKRREVMNLLYRLASYVTIKSDNNLEVLLSSGFPARNPSRTQIAFPKAVILHVSGGRSGQIRLRVRAIPNARGYEVLCAAEASEGAPGLWQNAGVFTNSRSIPISGLTPGKIYAFRVRAIGGSRGSGDWSDPVSHRCE